MKQFLAFLFVLLIAASATASGTSGSGTGTSMTNGGGSANPNVSNATGTLPLANGGTGVSATTGFVQAFPTVRGPISTDDTAHGYSINQFWNYAGQLWYSISTANAGFANWEIQHQTSAPICDLVTTCKGAYGVYRLKTSYGGNAFEVIRASDSALLAVPFDVNGIASWSAVDAFCLGTTCNVDIWYDQSGNGYDLAQATAANQPSIQGSYVGKLRAIQFGTTGGSLKFMANTSLPITDVRNISVMMALKSFTSGGITGNEFYDIGSPTGGKFSPGASQGPDFRGTPILASGSLYSVSAIPMTSDNINLIVDTAGAATLRQNNKLSSYTGGTIASVGTTGVQLGKVNAAGTYFLKANLVSFVIYDSALSAANQQTLMQAAYRDTGIQPQSANNVLLVGDSITEGAYSSGSAGDTSYSGQLAYYMPTPVNFYNVAFYGQTLATAKTQASTFAPFALTTGAKNIVTIFEGTNDLAQSTSSTAATVYADLQTICGTYRAAGYKCVVASLLPRTGGFAGGVTSASFEIQRQALEVLLLAGWSSFSDGFIDLTADPVIGLVAATTNPVLFQADQIHPTTPVGNSYITAAFIKALTPLLQ